MKCRKEKEPERYISSKRDREGDIEIRKVRDREKR